MLKGVSGFLKQMFNNKKLDNILSAKDEPVKKVRDDYPHRKRNRRRNKLARLARRRNRV